MAADVNVVRYFEGPATQGPSGGKTHQRPSWAVYQQKGGIMHHFQYMRAKDLKITLKNRDGRTTIEKEANWDNGGWYLWEVVKDKEEQRILLSEARNLIRDYGWEADVVSMHVADELLKVFTPKSLLKA